MASEDDTVVTYLQKHKIRAIFEDIETKLGKELPPDPIAFIIAKLQSLEKANKKSPSAPPTTTSPKRIASTSNPKAVSKLPGPAKPAIPTATGGHRPPAVTAVPKSASSPSTAPSTAKSTSSPSRPATAGSKVPAKSKVTSSPAVGGATRPTTAAAPAAAAPKGGRGPVGKTVPSTAAPKVAKPVTKSKVGVTKAGGTKEEGVVQSAAKPVVTHVASNEEEEEGRVTKDDEDDNCGGGEEEEELEMGMPGSVGGKDSSEDEETENGPITVQGDVQVYQLLDAHRRARLPRKCCSKAKAILELRPESPSLGYVSDASDESETEADIRSKPNEDQVMLSEEGVTSLMQTVSKVDPKLGGVATGDLARIRSLLCERCASLFPSSEATPTAKVGADVAMAGDDAPHDITTGTELPAEKDVANSNTPRDRYGWGL